MNQSQKNKIKVILASILTPSFLFATSLVAQAAVPTTSIAFHGQLSSAGTNVSGAKSITFQFYNALSGGSTVGSLISKSVNVTGGYFSTVFSALDLSGVDFNQSLWIAINVEGDLLSPRLSINSVPSAINAFGLFSYASAPTVGAAGALYYNTGDSKTYVSNGSAWVQLGGSQWTTAGSDVYYNTGNVGIGTTTPGSKLVVAGQIVGNNFVSLSTTATSTFAGPVTLASHCIAMDTRFRRRKKSENGQVEENEEEVDLSSLQIGDYIESFDEATQTVVFKKIENIFAMGIKSIIKIDTEKGYGIKTTEEHPYYAKKNSSADGAWVKVKDLSVGDGIAVIEISTRTVVFDTISSITTLPQEEVYDLEIEGTHTFIANNIVAHNTYVQGGLGVGVLNTSAGTFALKQAGTNAVILGDVSGNTRGANALDVQTGRISASQVASGNNSSAFGYKNTAAGSQSIAIGFQNTASVAYAAAVGGFNASVGANSATFGYGNAASSGNTAAIGVFNTASGYRSFALGGFNSAVGCCTSAFGYCNTVSGNYSAAFGLNVNNSTSDSVEIGPANTEKLQISGDGVNFVTSGLGGFCVNGVAVGGNLNALSAIEIGNMNVASGLDSSAVGSANTVLGNNASALGYQNSASGNYSSASGFINSASGVLSVSVGAINSASGYKSSAFGYCSVVAGAQSSGAGFYNIVLGASSAAFGYQNYAGCTGTGAIGVQNNACADCAVAFGNYNAATGINAVAFGGCNNACGLYSSAIGYHNTASSYYTSAFGTMNTASNYWASAVGYRNTGSGRYTSALGFCNTASGYCTSAVGHRNDVSGLAAQAFGHTNTASGGESQAMGYTNIASGNGSTASGYCNTASGVYSSAIGYVNSTWGHHSSAMGNGNTACGQGSSAFGYLNIATGDCSSVFGTCSTAAGLYSTAFGNGLINNDACSTMIGNGAGWIKVYSDGSILSSTCATLSAGGAWTNASDRNLKENFTDLNKEDILTKINNLPLTKWNYKKEDASIMHIGPMAQDFYAVFGLGGSDKSISTIDSAGIALVGVQALSGKVDNLYVELGLASTSVSNTENQGGVLSWIKALGATVVDGVAHFVNVVVGKITASDLTIKNETDVHKTGYVIYDRATGTPLCVFFENGIQKTEPGECTDVPVLPIVSGDNPSPVTNVVAPDETSGNTSGTPVDNTPNQETIQSDTGTSNDQTPNPASEPSPQPSQVDPAPSPATE